MNINTDIYEISTIRNILIPQFRKYGIVRGGLIGSYARGEATPKSDIDLLFQISKSMPLSEWNAFETDIQNCLGKEVDLIEFGSLSPRVEKEIQKELIVIYEQSE